MEGGPFKEWVAGTNQSIWLHGLTGCGKTILSSTVIDHLMNTQEHQHGKVDILAYFFDFNDKRKRNVENLLRSLVFQLYTLNPSTAVGAYLTDVHQQSTKANTSASSVDFKEILVSMINMSSQKRIFIILDALDECDERDELVGWLQALLNTTEQSTCHMLVTSRPEAVFLESLPLLFGLDMCMEIDRAAVDVDIMAYVHARLATNPKLRNLTKCSQDLQEQARRRIGGQAQGM
jgi:ABC-type dipeptide/oligopeptide/nickel transport system ATPase component